MRKLRALAAHIAVAVTLSVAGVAVAASIDKPAPAVNTPQATEQTQPTDTGTGAWVGPVPTNEPVQEQPTEVAPEPVAETPTDEPASITPDVPTSEPEAPAHEPTPEPEPEPVYVTSQSMRFVDVSSQDEPNSKAQQWCDYTYSDGTTSTRKNSTIYKQGGFSQPISSYSASNPPGVVSGC